MPKTMLIYRIKEKLLSYITIPSLEGAYSGGGTSAEELLNSVRFAQNRGYAVDFAESLNPQDREVFKKKLNI